MKIIMKIGKVIVNMLGVLVLISFAVGVFFSPRANTDIKIDTKQENNQIEEKESEDKSYAITIEQYNKFKTGCTMQEMYKFFNAYPYTEDCITTNINNVIRCRVKTVYKVENGKIAIFTITADGIVRYKEIKEEEDVRKTINYNQYNSLTKGKNLIEVKGFLNSRIYKRDKFTYEKISTRLTYKLDDGKCAVLFFIDDILDSKEIVSDDCLKFGL